MSYPDDLDDTTCALLALEKCGALEIDGEILSAYVQNLITTEKVPGGPYNTWITNSRNKTWNDVDIGVNANIAYFLSLREVNLKGLTTYIDTSVKKMLLTSLYYHSPFIICYFISRFYSKRTDRNTDEVRKLIDVLACFVYQKITTKNRKINTLELAIAVSTLWYLGKINLIPTNTEKKIKSAQESNGLWPALPLYIEEIKNGKTLYCESKELTTAFVLEALNYIKETQTEKVGPTKKNKIKTFETKTEALFTDFTYSLTANMRTDAQKLFKNIILKDPKKSIMMLPFLFNQVVAQKRKISKETLAELGLANTLGWIGYTIQDDVMDETKNTHLIPLSSICIQRAHMILVQKSASTKTIDEIFNLMDTANAWESANLKLTKDYKGFKIPKRLPSLAINSLAHKSLGHALGPLIVLMQHGFNPSSKEYKALKKFFIHYLIARQLNDDAHDWENDLRGGILNKISLGLLAHVPYVNRQCITEKLIIRLKKQFWKKDIETTCTEIKKHIKQARVLIHTLKIISDKTLFNEMLAPLEHSIEKVLSERKETLTFLKHYKIR